MVRMVLEIKNAGRVARVLVLMGRLIQYYMSLVLKRITSSRDHRAQVAESGWLTIVFGHRPLKPERVNHRLG